MRRARRAAVCSIVLGVLGGGSSCGGSAGGQGRATLVAPVPPATVDVVVVPEAVTVSWSRVEGATGYVVYWCEGDVLTLADAQRSPEVVGFAHVVPDLTPGATYCFAVAAVHDALVGLPSPDVIVRIPKFVPGIGTGPVSDLGPESSAEKVRLAVTTVVGAGGAYETVAVAAFQAGAGPEVWDAAGLRTAARDIFVVRSTDGGRSWTAPMNVSGTATSSSHDVDGDGDPTTPPVPYYGDCGKPSLVAQGATVVVTWEGRYVATGVQGSSVFSDAGGAEVPFAAVHVARSVDGGRTWGAPERLTDGSRDANETVLASASSGFALVWQEDALGLQPGDGEGPGDGGSGARVSAGTDLWYTALSASDAARGARFPTPVAVTDNAIAFSGSGDGHGGLASVADAYGDGGGPPLVSPGASRPVLLLVGKDALLAYEETKGGGGEGGEGKYVRYHDFTDFVAPLSTDATARAGTIVSDPARNGRRPRIVVQQSAGAATGLRLLLLWREGAGRCGTSADVVARVGRAAVGDAASTGLRPEDLVPAVAPDAVLPAGAATSDRPWNLTSTQGLGADTEDDALENARAHRGVVRGDRILVAYVWAADREAADIEGTAWCDLYVRRSEDGGESWDAPTNLSRLGTASATVVEPRFAPTPSSPDPAVVQRGDVVFLAWATQESFAADPSRPPPTALDVLVVRTPDFGRTWEESGSLAATTAAEQEAQLRASPDGSSLLAVWVSQAAGAAVSRVLAGLFEVELVPR
ncbi:MAG: hypothetical protein IT460_04525 [Planctomycetes bacterium]|nr:hypothetical protein [Planctomycetota bacterium]